MFKKYILGLFVFILIGRPFLPTLAYPKEDIVYSLCLVFTSILLLVCRGKNMLSIRLPNFSACWVFFAAVILSTAFSKDRTSSIYEFYKYACYLFVFLAVASLGLKQQKFLIFALLTALSIVSIRALQWFLGGTLYALDYLKHYGIHWPFAQEYLSRGRAFVPFTLPTDLAGYLILFIPLVFALSIKKNKSSHFSINAKNIFLLLVLVPSVLMLLATQSLGAILSLIISVIIFVFMHIKNIRHSFFIVCCAGILSVTSIVIFLRNIDPNSFNLPGFSFFSRLNYWKHALETIRLHPFIGSGPGNYPFFNGMWAHNAYLQVWAETGVFGFLGLLWLAIQTLKISFKDINEEDKTFYYGLWLGCLAFLIHNLVDTTFLHPEVGLNWWVIAAVLIGNKKGQKIE